MNADEAKREAIRALASRLRAWGIEDSFKIAENYLHDMALAGWIWMPPNNRPRPPKPHEACRDCGRHHDVCDCDGGPVTEAAPLASDPTTHIATLRQRIAPPPTPKEKP